MIASATPRLRSLASALALCAWLAACQADPYEAPEAGLEPMAELGRHLFYERRLSLNNNRSCGICHEPPKGFTDGFVRAVGATGQVHPRNTLTLLNAASRETLSWLHPEPQPVSEQFLIPLLGEDPIEQGASPILDEALRQMNADPTYRRLLASLPDPAPSIDLDLMGVALEAFVRQLNTYDSPYDRFLAGDAQALSPSAQRGAALFFSDAVPCASCHGGLDFDQPGDHGERHGWFNTGLYDLGQGQYPPGRQGLFELTGAVADTGRYRVPTLRHLALTAPYYHDGTGASLADVIDNYNEGGRLTSSGPFEGDGRQNPHKDPRIQPLNLSPAQRADLEAFLVSLTDLEAVERPEWGDPWPRED